MPNNWRLAIAPRHVERADEVMRLVTECGFKAARFSQLKDSVLSLNTVVVVDTIGYLRYLYAKASLVFVGKSLCVGGGHNIIEPAFYAKPIIVGPMMQNFRDITALFKAQGAIVQAKDIQDFNLQIEHLIKEENLRTKLGHKAYAVVQANQGAGKRTLQMIEKFV